MRKMAVRDVMAEYTHGYDMDLYPTWEALVEYFKSDEYHGPIVSSLVAQLEKVGGFRVPIMLNEGFMDEAPIDDDDDEIVIDSENDRYIPAYVGNGNHRFVAAILAGVEMIDVIDSEENTSTPNYDLTMTVEHNADFDVVNELFDYLTDIIVSLPVDGGDSWISSDGSYRSHNEIVWGWFLDGDIDETRMRVILDGLISDFLATLPVKIDFSYELIVRTPEDYV